VPKSKGIEVLPPPPPPTNPFALLYSDGFLHKLREKTEGVYVSQIFNWNLSCINTERALNKGNKTSLLDYNLNVAAGKRLSAASNGKYIERCTFSSNTQNISKWWAQEAWTSLFYLSYVLS
jgi:hypothetical protein